MTLHKDSPSSSDPTPVYNYGVQWRSVLAIEFVLMAVAVLVFSLFWTSVCDDTLRSCVAEGTISGPLTFLVLSAIRPLVFTPVVFVALLGGQAFGPFWGAALTAAGSVVSCYLIFAFGKVLGRRMVKPWLSSNLPATFRFLRSQDYKIVFALRLVPIIPFDLLSLVFGALNFRTKSVLIATFFGVLPETFLVARLMHSGSSAPIQTTLESLAIIATMLLVPLITFEFLTRKKGGGLWMRTKAMYQEISYEVKANNEIVKRHTYTAEKTPVLLLYGFFASRRSLTVLERLLVARGHQVLSFNLGGLLGTFFTRGIIETAEFIDYKIKRQIERHGFKKVHIVAHSKGGMVALWWTLQMGGSKYCDRVVTMGTPFRGSRLTYLALITPLGFFFRDMWQMRPGSRFLNALHSLSIPDNMKVICLHSAKDSLARGEEGLFKPTTNRQRVESVAIDTVSHFEFLYKRHVCEIISQKLSEAENEAAPSSSALDEGPKPQDNLLQEELHQKKLVSADTEDSA